MQEEFRNTLLQNIDVALSGIQTFLTTQGSIKDVSEVNKGIVKDANSLYISLSLYKNELSK